MKGLPSMNNGDPLDRNGSVEDDGLFPDRREGDVIDVQAVKS